MRLYRALCLILPTLVLSSCFWGDECDTKHLTGHYYLVENTPSSSTWDLHFDDEEFGLADGLTRSSVAEVGFNTQCIVVRATGTEARFYIVPLIEADDRAEARQNIIGPLSRDEFELAQQKYHAGGKLTSDSSLTDVS